MTLAELVANLDNTTITSLERWFEDQQASSWTRTQGEEARAMTLTTSTKSRKVITNEGGATRNHGGETKEQLRVTTACRVGVLTEEKDKAAMKIQSQVR